MLKKYMVKTMFQLNNQGKWIHCGYNGYICDDESEIESERIIINSFTWCEMHEYLKNNLLNGFCNGCTSFRKRPYIVVNPRWSNECYTFYNGNFETISVKQTCDEEKYVSLDWIIKNLPAEKTIQYLKERGVTACPIMK